MAKIPITKEKYEAYLKTHFPATDKYIFYTGQAKNQVIEFIDSNPNKGYNWFDSVYTAPTDDHPWYLSFDRHRRRRRRGFFSSLSVCS
jgi:hypothetical protein